MSDKIQDVLKEVEIERLTPHPNNPRRGDIAAIAASLERFGQVKPLIVQRWSEQLQKGGIIVAGNHTYQAALRLKWPTVKILVKDMDDEEAKGYLIADNRTADKATYDHQEHYKVMAELSPEMREILGIDEDEMETLADQAGATVVEGAKGEAIRTQATPQDGSRGRIAADGVTRMRDIVLLMSQEDAQVFGQQISQLQNAYGTRTVVETVRRVIAEAASTLPSFPKAPTVMAGPE